MTNFAYPILEFSAYDGDSFTLLLDLGFGIRKVEKVRLNGIDTPELRDGIPKLRAAAKLALKRVEEFTSAPEATRIYLSEKWKDKYGRGLGSIEINGNDLGTMLLDERLAVPYQGENKQQIKHLHMSNADWLIGQGTLQRYAER